MNRKFLILTIIGIVGGECIAQIPRGISYQGVLSDILGKPRPDSIFTFTFGFYDSTGVLTPLWSESKTLRVRRGLFSTALGDVTPFSPSLKFDKQHYLGILVGTDPELSPRIPLTSLGYSMHALRTDTAKVAVASQGDEIWSTNGADVYRLNTVSPYDCYLTRCWH